MKQNPDRYEYESSIRLSNRQYAALRMFADLGKRDAISARKGLEVDERSLRSLVIRKYIEFDARRGFKVTDRGLERIHAWDDTDIILTRKKTHYGAFLQGVDQALSGTFRHKPEKGSRAIPISHAKRKARKAA